MSSDPEQEYFSDGISEEILNSLAKIKDLKVAGRTSSFAFKGQNQDLRQIGDTLGVEHILEGSVRKAGATVRITAQLIQVDDGFQTDIFAIQDEISSAILEQLRAHLVGLEQAPALVAADRTDSEVYDLYLLARQRMYERKKLSIESAAELLDKAIAADPEYAPAYAQRGITALLLSEESYGELANSEATSQGRLYLDRALQLDPDLAEAWAGLGLYHSSRPGEFPQAIEALEKALALNPNLIDASNWLQIAYGETGESRRALAILEDMVARDPLYPPGYSNAIYVYNYFDMQDKSWALLERVRPFMPGDPNILQAEARIWMSVARPSKALPLLEQAHASQPNDRVTSDIRSEALLGTAQFERAAEGGSPWARVLAMTRLGRGEEARLLASQLAGEGLVWPMLAHLVVTGQYAALAQFVDSRWTDLAAFEAENPDSGDGYHPMLNIAVAYARLGDEERFGDAMRRVRAAHDRARLQYAEHGGLLFGEARYFAMLGDTEQAVAYLEQAMERHFRPSVPLHEITPELEPLRGDPRYQALLARMNELLNGERAELGLDPVST
jgi:TolB-like protein